jgi:hypothetical protein
MHAFGGSHLLAQAQPRPGVERVEHKRRYLPELALLAAFMSLGGKGHYGRCWWRGLVNRKVVESKGGIVIRLTA